LEHATSAHAQEAYLLTRTSHIALQVVRTSFGFHLRECMGSCFPPPTIVIIIIVVIILPVIIVTIAATTTSTTIIIIIIIVVIIIIVIIINSSFPPQNLTDLPITCKTWFLPS